MVIPCSLCSPFSFGNNPGGIKEVAPNRAVGETRVQSLSFENLEDVIRGNGRAVELAPKLRGEVDAVHKKLGGCRKEAQVNDP